MSKKKEPINFVEWDEKHNQYLIRLAGELDSQNIRLNKMLASKDMYEALKEASDWLTNFIDTHNIIDPDGDTEILQHHINKALAKAEGK